MAQAAGLIGMGTQLLGTGAGTVGNVMSADVNAKIQDIASRTITENAQFDERQFRRKAEIAKGSNIATAAASGVDITRGNALFDQLDMAKQTEIEAQSIRRAGKIDSDAKKFESRMTRRQIPFDIIGGAAGAGSILTRLAGK